MFFDDTEYLASRAERQLELAQLSDDPAVVAAHYTIADTYLERIAAEAEAEPEAAAD